MSMQMAIFLHYTPEPTLEKREVLKVYETMSSDRPPYTPTDHPMPNMRHATKEPQ